MIKNLPMVIAQPAVEDEEAKDRFGRSTKFKPEYIEMARVLAEDGATDKEIARELDNTPMSTFYHWRNTIPLFQAVLKLGKESANDRLERAAYDLAVGYTTSVTVHMKLKNSDGSEKMVEIEQEVRVAPDARLLQWMLKNRKPDVWRDRTEVAGEVEIIHLTAEQAKERLKAKIEEIKQHQLGNNQASG